MHTKLFRALLWCYPAEFRHEYGVEMEQLFTERLRSESRTRLWLETLADVALTAPKEHAAILANDLKHELRVLRTMPGFTAIILFVMALGIGSTVAVFSLVNAVLFRSLPYAHPETLVYLWTPNPEFKGVPNEIDPNVPAIYDWQRLSHTIAHFALLNLRDMRLVQGSNITPLGVSTVSADFFSTLGVHAILGRSINANDDQPGQEFVAVISHALWLSHFHARPGIIGESIQLNRLHYVVIGVTPPDFGYPYDGDVPNNFSNYKHVDIWIPTAYTPKDKINRDDFKSAAVVARLKPGITAAAAEAELRQIQSQLNPLYPPKWRGWTVLAKPLVETILGPVQQMLWLLLGSVALVLLIAVSNVAGLLVARTASRAHELGIRAALGAERARIIRQLLTESLLLSCTGGSFGIALAYLLVRLIINLNPGDIPRFEYANIDAGVLLVAVAISLAVGIASGLWPAISASTPSISELLKRGGTRIAFGAPRGRSTLIVLEVALSVVLLTGACLLIRSYLNLQTINPGFSLSSLTAQVQLDENYPTQTSQTAFYKQFLSKLQAIPGFQIVGSTTGLPLNDDQDLLSLEIQGFGEAPELVEAVGVTPSYRQAIGTPLLRGRDFTAADLKTHNVMINQRFAQMYLRGHNPLGAKIRFGTVDDRPWRTVIGVTGDVRDISIEKQPKPSLLLPVEVGDSFAVRSSLPAHLAATQARSALHSLDRAVKLDVGTMHERVSESNARRTFQTSLLTAFAAIAIILALVGLYGLMSQTVKQRTPEIGIRLAIGSPRSRILTLILAQGLRLTTYGLLIGLAASYALTRLIHSWLFQIQPTDPLTFTLVPLAILGVSAAACLIPALSATRIDPIQTLRQE